MEIVATIDNGYMIKIKKTELEKLTGYYYGNREFAIGQIIQVDKLYRQLTSLVKQHEDIKKLSHTLKTAAGMLEIINPIFYEEK